MKNQFRVLNICLWVLQVILGFMFIMAGGSKLFQSMEQLATTLPWVNQVSPLLVRFIGLSEFLGGIGLLLPSILGIRPKLTGWAALGIAAIMILAIAFHLSRGEGSMVGVNLPLVLIAFFIAWGRLQKAPIAERAKR